MVGQGSHAANRGFKLNGVKVEQGDIITDGRTVLRVGHTDYLRGKTIVRTTTLDGHKRSYVTFIAHRESHGWWVISEHSAWLYQK